jgi:signal transduction histidine kinase
MIQRYSLRTLMQTASVRTGLLDEIVARNVAQLQELRVVPTTRPISILNSLYTDTIASLRTHYTQDRQLEVKLSSLDARHGMVIETFADAFSPHLQPILPQLLRRQASISVLLQHAVGLTSARYFNATGAVEIADVVSMCQDVKNQAIMLAEHQHNWSCDVQVVTTSSATTPTTPTPGNSTSSSNSTSSGNSSNSINSINITCVPSFLRFALLEVVKNAVGATIEEYEENNRALFASPEVDLAEMMSMAPICVITIHDTPDAVEVTVADQGVGMSPEEQKSAFDFLHSSTIKVGKLVDGQASYQPMSAPLKGLGVGLCISRTFVTHFGGQLTVTSLGKRKGTVVSLKIPKDIDISEDL